jgi:hypothetical protein
MSRPTSRGILWEVLSPVIRWPLHSPTRFVAVIAAVIAAIFLASTVGGSSPVPTVGAAEVRTRASSGSAPPSPSSSVPTSPPSGSPSSGAPTATPDPVPPPAAKVAASFLAAWARPSAARQAWYAALRPMATADLAKGLAAADPRNVPASKVTGALRAREVSPNLTAPTRAVLVADTNAGPIAVTVTLSGTTWLVQGIAPDEQGGAEA